MSQLKVGAFGKQDSYSYLAAKAAYKAVTPIPIPYTRDIFEELKLGNLDIAVVPLENTSGGWVEDVVYELIKLSVNDPTAKVVKEIGLPVILCLAGKNKDIELNSVKRIYSHPYPLVHSGPYLYSRDIHAERIETTSTSEAAEKAAKDGDSVAICNSAAAHRTGLKILIDHIPADVENTTRFLSVSGGVLPDIEKRTKSCLWFSGSNVPGSLYRSLEIFYKRGINLTRILSRSVDGFKSYRFFIEIDGDINSSKMKPLISELKNKTQEMAIIGSYPVLNVTKLALERLSN